MTDGTECYIDEELDGRRKISLKRSQENRDILSRFMDMIRTGQNDAHIINLIRSGASLEQVTVAIRSSTASVQSGLPDHARSQNVFFNSTILHLTFE